MVKGLFILDKKVIDQVYPPNIKKEIEELADIIASPLSRDEVYENKEILKDVEVIFSSWGGPKLDADFLEAAPNLKALFYAAGSVKKIVTDASWKKGIKVMNANEANAVPVAEYTLSQILFSLKNGWQMVRKVRKTKTYPDWPHANIKGAFGSTVGLISLSTVGRKVNELLKYFDINVLAYDPFVDEKEAKELNVELCSLEDIFKRSDVVSLHSPLLEETKGMIKGKHIASMKENRVFINTARGAIVKELEMINVLKERPDLTAILDVTYPEPPEKDSDLFLLDNVVLTPHIAGSEGEETGRMGAYMLEEFKRYLNGEELKWEVTKEAFKHMA
ncbi:MAG TPA: hydroxyacid dehydrogenase [Tissierellales bacterium]|nr:hydroxyacid dehydrogenase [Tissierellales bacterium]